MIFDQDQVRFDQNVNLLRSATSAIIWRERGRQHETSLEARRVESLKELDDPGVKAWVTWLDSQDRWTATELSRAALRQIPTTILLQSGAYQSTNSDPQRKRLELAWKAILDTINESLDKDELDAWFVQEVMTHPSRIHGGFGDHEEQVALFTHRVRIMFNKIVGKLRENGNSSSD